MIKRETKKNIFDHFDMEEINFSGRMSDLKFLSTLYDLEKLPSYDSRYDNALQDIAQHSEWNDDYQGNWAFDGREKRFELYENDVAFLKFIAYMAHPLVHQDSNKAQRIITIANDWMKEDGWEIYPIREIAGGKVYGYRQTNAVQKPKENELVNIWESEKLRFFISHRDAHKAKATALGEELSPYGISSFVAHDSIESNSIWKDEIVKALQTMDACICYLTPDFYESVWTNQEVGYAIAKGVPIYLYSIDRTDPKGFKHDQQAFKKGFPDLLHGIKKDFQGYSKFKKNFLKNFLDARDGNWDNAKNKFYELVGLTFNDKEIEFIANAFNVQAKITNQLLPILRDKIKAEHKNHLNLKGYTYYWEYLDKEILKKHTQIKYSVLDGKVQGVNRGV